jgi:hypothetical protein
MNLMLVSLEPLERFLRCETFVVLYIYFIIYIYIFHCIGFVQFNLRPMFFKSLAYLFPPPPPPNVALMFILDIIT